MRLILKIITIFLFLIVSASANPFGQGYVQDSNPFGQGYIQDSNPFGPGYVQDKSVFGFGN